MAISSRSRKKINSENLEMSTSSSEDFSFSFAFFRTYFFNVVCMIPTPQVKISNLPKDKNLAKAKTINSLSLLLSFFSFFV